MRSFVLAAILCAPVAFVHAQTTSCTRPAAVPPSAADEALAKGQFDDAAKLYAARPPSSAATAGIVRAELGQRKLDDALALIQKESVAHPNDALLLDVLGEVRFRRGETDEAALAFNASNRLDHCSARIHYDIGRYMNFNGLYASAQVQLNEAHQLAPEDPLIARAWNNTQRVPLTPDEQIARLEEREKAGSLTEVQKSALENSIKAIQARERGDCELVEPITTARIPLYAIQFGTRPPTGSGVDVSFNGKRRRLKLDTGAGGLNISYDAARALGLTPEAEGRAFGFGDAGVRTTYIAHVDDLKIGPLEFHNCIVNVFESKQVMTSEDGLLGADVFRSFLVTLDLPAQQMRLSPLPPRPDDANQKLSLSTSGDQAGSEESLTVAERKKDRYVAPEMANWQRIFRSGHMLIFPTSIGKVPKKLFVMDTGASTTLISPAAAREVTSVSGDSDRHVRGISGDVKNVFGTDNLTIGFANVSQIQAGGLSAVDLSSFSRSSGVEISGFIGYPLLRELVISIDYRDNLVHVTYTPHVERGRF
jgi:tetratricopeptide (TPR) repeat protein